MELTEKEGLKLFVEDIINTTLPDEAMSFDIFGDEHIDKLYKGEDITKQQTVKGGEFEAGVGFTETLQFVFVLSATFKTIFEVVNLARKERKPKTAETKTDDHSLWMQNLIDAGLKKELAIQLAERYKEQFDKLLNSKLP